jgi:hypothetical protein
MRKAALLYRACGRAIVMLLLTFSIVGCSPSEQAQIQTAVAPVASTMVVEGQRGASTAIAGGQSAAATQAARLMQTAQPGVHTRAVSVKATGAAQVATQAARLGSGAPPATPLPPKDNEIVTYAVVTGDNLSLIASRFSTTVDTLVTLNKDRYPSLVQNPRYVEVGWTLILSGKARAQATPATPIPATWSQTPGCDISNVDWLDSPLQCEPMALNYVSEVGHNIGCVSLDEGNWSGYYMVHTALRGFGLKTREGGLINYGWYVDRETNRVVIGPSIVTARQSVVECGIPGHR